MNYVLIRTYIYGTEMEVDNFSTFEDAITKMDSVREDHNIEDCKIIRGEVIEEL